MSSLKKFQQFTLPALCALTLLALSLAPALRAADADEHKPETLVTVSVARVIKTTLRATVTAYGTIEAAPLAAAARPGDTRPPGSARLAAGAPGNVATVTRAEGDRVQAGDLIVQLDTRAADAALSRATAALTAAQQARDRQTRLQAADATSQRALLEADERLAAARAELASAEFTRSQLELRAPISGVITALQTAPGEWLEAGKVAAEIVNPDRLVLSAQIPLAESAALQPGQPATLFARLDAGANANANAPAPLATGALEFISPRVTPGANTVLVRIALPPATASAPALQPGRFLGVRIVTETRPDRLAVPIESVYTDGEGRSTLSIVDDNIAHRKTVKLGLRDGPLVEVEGEGITENAVVVTIGSYALPETTKVRVQQN